MNLGYVRGSALQWDTRMEVAMVDLDPRDYIRYSRHFALPEVGREGQIKLKNSSAFLVGAGGLGSPLALYLAAAGVGRLGLVDFDVVDESNLQRQVLHGTAELGRSKLASAEKRLRDLNPLIQIECHETRLTSENARQLFDGYQVVADGADNFPTRYLVNDACYFTGLPLVSGSILGFEGQLSVFNYAGGPCYRCLFPEPPPPGSVPTCAEGGVLGVLPGTIGSMQANEVIKILLGIGQVASGRLLLYDALALNFQTIKFEKDPDCALCGHQATIKELIDYQQFCGFEPRDDLPVPEIEPADVTRSKENPLIIDVRQSFEREICQIEGSLHIPLAELSAWTEPERGREIVVYCKSGERSARAVRQLHARGYARVTNLRGGILAWIEQVQPHLTRY
jgi:adenylyltransferase/sulfurtransferase